MNAHNCRVGTVRTSTKNKLISKSLKKSSIKQEPFKNKSFDDFQDNLNG